MPSRKKRKRYRLRAAATVSEPKSRGGWGKGLVTRSDLRLLRRAIRENWQPTDEVCGEIVRDVTGIFDDPDASPRLQIGAAWCVIEMVRQNSELLSPAIAGRTLPD